jgi:hypothetical protein
VLISIVNQDSWRCAIVGYGRATHLSPVGVIHPGTQTRKELSHVGWRTSKEEEEEGPSPVVPVSATSLTSG